MELRDFFVEYLRFMALDPPGQEALARAPGSAWTHDRKGLLALLGSFSGFYGVVGPGTELQRLRERDSTLDELDCLVDLVLMLAERGQASHLDLGSTEWALIRRMARASLLALGVEAGPPRLGYGELCSGATA